jgi:hypothetical protein
MITRADAEEIAAGWARGESARRGYECRPMISEFELGFVVWTSDGLRTMIDRETGALSSYPLVPAPRRNPERWAETRRRPAPGTVAHLTVDGRSFSACGAKGDRQINHHPLVAAYLAALEPGQTVRGTARHAELIVLSDALSEADRRCPGPLTPDEARTRLRGARFEAYLVRDTGDPLGGTAARPCESCILALVDFGLLPWSQLAFLEPLRPYSGNIAQPGRFPDQVAGALAEAGWRPMRRAVAEVLADGMIDDVRCVPGRRHQHRPFPAARAAIRDFPGIFCGLRGPGGRRRIRRLSLEPAAAAYTADLLGDFAAVLGVALFPIGVEAGGDAIVAIDERGRLFALDQGGEWFLGETLDEGLLSLLTGDGPAERVRDDGTW